MKIAIINTCFTGATLPLVRRMIERGYSVDMYEVYSRHLRELEAFTYEDILLEYGVGDIEPTHFAHMGDYMNLNRFRLRYISMVRPFQKVPVVRSVMKVWRRRCMEQACRLLERECYDRVLFVAQYWDNDFIPLLRGLTCAKIFAIHEVCNHLAPDFSTTPPLLKEVLRQQVPVVVFSEKTGEDLRRYEGYGSYPIKVSRFGLFETFRCFLNAGIPTDVPQMLSEQGFEDYYLFIGGLKRYKGISVFVDAILKTLAERPNLKFVIAGGGHDDSVDLLKQCRNVLIVNHYLSNMDFVGFIQHCKAVVCPYLTASQSGIPQTAFVFGKPVIASNLESFQALIGNNHFGVLCEPGNPDSLARAITMLDGDGVLYSQLVDNISRFEELNPLYDWDNIMEEIEGLNIEASI